MHYRKSMDLNCFVKNKINSHHKTHPTQLCNLWLSTSKIIWYGGTYHQSVVLQITFHLINKLLLPCTALLKSWKKKSTINTAAAIFFFHTAKIISRIEKLFFKNITTLLLLKFSLPHKIFRPDKGQKQTVLYKKNVINGTQDNTLIHLVIMAYDNRDIYSMQESWNWNL